MQKQNLLSLAAISFDKPQWHLTTTGLLQLKASKASKVPSIAPMTPVIIWNEVKAIFILLNCLSLQEWLVVVQLF